MIAKPIFEPLFWSHSTNIYEVNIRQYTQEGTFVAFAQHLHRLADMGVETLWLMPVTPIGKKGRKGSMGSYYAGADFVTTNPEFGTIADFKQLVAAAHALGMKVIIDWVANHTALDHTWVAAHPHYYLKDNAGNFTERNGWDDVIDLDYKQTALRIAMVEAMAFWVHETGIDGFRCDMAHLVPLDFWESARTFLDTIRPLFWLAECEEANYHPVFDSTYTWQWMHATKNMVQQQLTATVLDKVLYQYEENFPISALRLFFTANHDENSWNGTEYEKYGRAALPLAVFAATWSGIPLLYSGQELPNLKRLAFFEKDPIEWQTPIQLHAFYQTLLKLRKQHPALLNGSAAGVTLRLNLPYERMFGFIRHKADKKVLVLLNFSEEPVQFFLNDPNIQGNYKEVFAMTQHNFSVDRQVRMPAYGFLVFEC